MQRPLKNARHASLLPSPPKPLSPFGRGAQKASARKSVSILGPMQQIQCRDASSGDPVGRGSRYRFTARPMAIRMQAPMKPTIR